METPGHMVYVKILKIWSCNSPRNFYLQSALKSDMAERQTFKKIALYLPAYFYN